MNRAAWELRRGMWRLGKLGALGLLLLGVALVIALVEIVPLRNDIARRQVDLDARTLALREPPPPPPDEASGPSNANQRFFRFLHSFHAIAASNGLAIPQVSYGTTVEPGSTVQRYLIETSFQSSYPQLSGFIRELRRLPGTHCEHVSAARPNIGATRLDIRMQCVFAVESAS